MKRRSIDALAVQGLILAFALSQSCAGPIVTSPAEPAEPGDAARVLAFSLDLGGRSYPGSIDEASCPPSIRVRLPSTASLESPLVASFSLSDPAARATIGGVSQEAGTTMNDFSAPLDFLVSSEGARDRSYRVSAEPNPVTCAFGAFCPCSTSPYAEKGRAWLEFSIMDEPAMGGAWRLMAGGGGATACLFSAADLDALPPAARSPGARIRLHGPGWEPEDSSSPAEAGDPGAWDLAAAAEPYSAADHGLLWLEDGAGDVLDALAWRSGTAGPWLSGPALQALEGAVAACQWGSSEAEGAFILADVETHTGRLRAGLAAASRDGNEAGHWEAWQAPYARIVDAAVEPPWIQVTPATGAELRLSARLESLGAVGPLCLHADLSALGGTAAQALNDEGLGGDDAAGDGTWSLAWTIPPLIVEEGWRSIALAASAAISVAPLEAAFVLSPLPPPAPKPLLPGGDMETDLDLATRKDIVAYEETTGQDGLPTRALRVAGSLGANSTILLSAGPCAARSLGFRRASFLLRAGTGGIPKAINLEFGTATTGIPAGQLFRLVSDWSGDALFEPSGSSFLYTATPGADSGGRWVKAILNIEGTDTARPLLLRLGAGSYDFWIDDLLIEP